MKIKTISIRSLYFCISIGLTPAVLSAQSTPSKQVSTSKVNLPKISRTSAMGTFEVSFANRNISSEYLVAHLGEWLQSDSDHQYILLNVSEDGFGFKRHVYQHFFKNVKVADELIIIHEKENKVSFVNGENSPQINLVIVPILPQDQIEDLVKSDMKSAAVTFSDFEQVITKVITERGVNLHLVSQIDALSISELKGYMYFIDNTTHRIVKKLEKIHHHAISFNNVDGSEICEIQKNYNTSLLADSPSSSATFYKGNQQITVDSFNGAFRLKDNARNIHTKDGAGWNGNATATDGLLGNITEYTSPTANFTANATKPAVEVHWAMKNAHDYYVLRHGRNSYDGNGSIIRNYYNINFNSNPQTNVPQPPINGANAAAIDQQGVVAMIYGNGLYQGQSGFFNPVVGLDIAGHEYSHLIVSRSANLAYQGESGALNESFADIFGAAIEFYSNINPNWTIAEGIPNAALGATFFRDMSNPNAGSSQIGGQQPDTYTGTYWTNVAPPFTEANDYGGVHNNSGVGNYWFYLLSAGGSGINDAGTSYNVSGITIQKAEKIAYRTLTSYLTANSQYINAYASSKQAAIDLYGAGSNELQQVENAWCAVGLGSCSQFLSVSDLSPSIKNDIEIYPNPINNGHFTIKSKSKMGGSYEIHDASGRIVKFPKELNNAVEHVDITGISSGIYFVVIKIDGQTTAKKIVVQ